MHLLSELGDAEEFVMIRWLAVAAVVATLAGCGGRSAPVRTVTVAPSATPTVLPKAERQPLTGIALACDSGAIARGELSDRRPIGAAVTQSLLEAAKTLDLVADPRLASLAEDLRAESANPILGSRIALNDLIGLCKSNGSFTAYGGQFRPKP